MRVNNKRTIITNCYNLITMKPIYLLLSLIIALFSLSCSTDNNNGKSDVEWSNIGLNVNDVTLIEIQDDILYATDNKSINKIDLDDNNSEWEKFNFDVDYPHEFISDILFFKDIFYLVVSTTEEKDDIPDNFTTLFKSGDNGNKWEEVDIQIEDQEQPYILDKLKKSSSGNSLYSAPGYIYKFNIEDNIWVNMSSGLQIGFIESLYVSEYQEGQVWVGGWKSTFKPYLARTLDDGLSWKVFTDEELDINSDATIYSVLSHPEKKDEVLIGLGGSTSSANMIRKSENGGLEWKSVFSGKNIRSIANSKMKTDRVYASGISDNGELFIVISDDFGNNWSLISYEDNSNDFKVNDIIVKPENDSEKVYLSTNKGIYSVEFRLQ